MNYAQSATYVKNKSTGLVDSTVINIEAGWSYGVYQTYDNKLMTWGCNEYGQLGNNSTSRELSAIPLAPPAGKSYLDPLPTISNFPSNLITCEENIGTITLSANFLIAPSLASSYNVIWFEGNQFIKEGVPNQENNTLTPTDSGLYKVSINYIGTNNGCQTYPRAVKHAQIDFYEKEFTVDLAQYCADEAAVKVSSSDLLRKPVYDWYASVTSEESLGTSTSGDTATIDISTVGNSKTVYVSETSYNSGLVFPKETACDTNFQYLSVPLQTSKTTPYTKCLTTSK